MSKTARSNFRRDKAFKACWWSSHQPHILLVRPHHLRMQTRPSYRTIIIALLFCVVGQTWAAEKEWVTLTDCQYVDSRDNDGDSFRVHCGEKEFRARLYFVDAPETTLTYAERTREQSLHFGITLDETMKAGV